jgi:hypothetical protein
MGMKSILASRLYEGDDPHAWSDSTERGGSTMQETDPDLIEEIKQHGEDDDGPDEELEEEVEEAIPVPPTDPEDLKQEQDVHDDGVDEKIDEAFK